MNSEKIETILQVIDAIDNDWALSDDSDNLDYMTLVDSNRLVHDLKPLKSLIQSMEKDALIKTNEHFEKREYMNLLGEKHPVPFVYLYEVTQKGRMFEKLHRENRNTINCKMHGTKTYVICCHHFFNTCKEIAYTVPEEKDDPAQIWCETCEEARMKDKGWNDYADEVASWKIICYKCYEEKLEHAKEIILYD